MRRQVLRTYILSDFSKYFNGRPFSLSKWQIYPLFTLGVALRNVGCFFSILVVFQNKQTSVN